jgi:hypothetical protein
MGVHPKPAFTIRPVFILRRGMASATIPPSDGDCRCLFRAPETKTIDKST